MRGFAATQVSRRFNSCCQRLLNQGFFRAERFHAKCLKAVKKQLPRRESERRTHPLARHCEILTSIETRLSLLSMTFMKYMDMSLCCFIPGKVIDEIFRVLRLVQRGGTPPRAHEILQELRDISSMAMEHFDERIAPGLKLHMAPMKPGLGLAFLSQSCGDAGVARGSDMVAGSATSLLGRVPKPGMSTSTSLGLTEEMKQLRTCNSSLRKAVTECRSKLNLQIKKLRDQEKRAREQSQVVAEQGSRLAEQEGKLNEMNRKLLEQHREFSDVLEEVSRLREQVLSSCGECPGRSSSQTFADHHPSARVTRSGKQSLPRHAEQQSVRSNTRKRKRNVTDDAVVRTKRHSTRGRVSGTVDKR